MGVLQRFERRIENLVNRPFARAFKAEVQPVEIASALQRECDHRAAIVARGRTMVPNDFVVELGPHDHDRLAPYAGPLGDELADMVREHAEEQRYSFIGPVRVALELVDDLGTGLFRIRSGAAAGAGPHDPGPRGPRKPRPPTSRSPYLDLDGTHVALAGASTVIGRGTDVHLRIDDPGVSRRHAEVRVRGDRATIVDLGSTNGVVVDGRRVEEAELHDGTKFVLGSTTVLFRFGEDG